jgi:hypothetical protein
MTAESRLRLTEILTEILASVILAVATSGCGGGGGGNNSLVPTISVAITPAAATVQWGATTQLTATVSNDSSNRGVNWKISCSSVPCGALSSNSTASGAPTKYSPPIALPAANLRVTLTASSVADPTKSATASITVPQLPGFAGVSEAHVDKVNGIARLIISGKPAPPLWFEYPQDFPTHIQFLTPQVQDAASHGINTVSVALNSWPWDNQNTAPLDYSAADQVIDNTLAANPRVLLVLNISAWPGSGWKPPVPLTSADYIVYPDGPTHDTYHISMASDTCFNGFLTSLPHLLQHYENSSYAAHILGYIINWGGTGEWYPVEMWRGPDYSPVNTQHFESWLKSKYGTDAVLSAAWGMPVTIATAQVPAPQTGRFPMHSVIGSNAPIDAFYQLAQEQNWVDYSAYVSDLASQRILDAAQAIKTGTGGKRLVGVHYGYLIEAPGSYNGHERQDQLFTSPNVDFLSGAITPYDRLAGGAGQGGAAVDSVNANGKLWFNELDLYTYLGAGGPFASDFGPNPPTADLTETVDVLQRETASLLVHRSGTWWFDIGEEGNFDDPSIWTVMSDYGTPLYQQLYDNPQPFKPDVALIIDRNSILYQKSDDDMMTVQRAMLRYALAKAGVSYGIYTLDDFLDGVLSPCQLYIFANTNYLTDSQIMQIQSRLNNEGSTAIWQYAPGFLGPNGADVTRASTLTGIQLAEIDGYGYTNGTGPMAGYSWGLMTQNVLSPRLVVTDPAAQPLGSYQSDGQVSSAQKKVGNFESIFIGELALGAFTNTAYATSPPPDVLRALLQIAGVHIWSTAGDVVITDGNLLVIHAEAAGPDAISLPPGISATSLGGGPSSTGTLNINFLRVGETRWFQLSPPYQGGASSRVRRDQKRN